MTNAPVPADTPSPPPVPFAGARLVIERLAGVTVVGWAFDPAAPGRERLTLVCGMLRFSLTARRLPRNDVSRALGVHDLDLGFEFELPLEAWQALAGPGATFGVALGEGAPVSPAWRPRAADLHGWMTGLTQHLDPARARTALAALEPHLEQARRWGTAEGSGPLPTVVLSAVEGWQGLCLSGWLGDQPEARETVRLRCGERRYEVAWRRVSRRDVSDLLHLTHEDVGFELEVPGRLWHDSPGAEGLELQVEGRGGPIGNVFRLTREELPARLEAALALPEPMQRAQQALLAMEHLGWGGDLADITPDARRALEVLAASAGVGSWLDDALRGPAALEARAAQATALRKPFRVQPRGRLGRWLREPRHARRALALLVWLRGRSSLQNLATRLEIALTRAVGLFDKATYDEQIAPADRAHSPALRHYVEQGDARSLVPMVLFDARHYVGQLEGRRHPGVNRLLHYGLFGRHQGLSPCAWFEPTHYLKANADVQASGKDPLEHFVNWGWQERRRPAARFEPTSGMRQTLLQRLAQGEHDADGATHPMDPLQRYLLDGLPAEAQPAEAGQLPWAVPARLEGRDFLELTAWRGLPARPAAARIDVIVPVYAGAQETLRCLWSVLSAAVETPFELVVIDDCSPEPALSAHLRELAALGLIRLLVNERNLGFVATVNIGLVQHPDRDVVILNSDTRVHAGWLDRLAAHGQAEPRAASVTPLSNNATVCSYPRMLHSNWEKLELDDAGLDALAAEANRGRHVEVPTGVGFCMWMRRSAIHAVGLLDTERFGRGYGEENDWCMRANAAGWVQLVASDVYVLHQGSVSFRSEASERTRAGVATLLQRHPDYQRRIDQWIEADPLHAERARLDAARLARTAHAGDGGLVLMINHARGGGTARHELEAAEHLRSEAGQGVVALRPSRRPGCVRLASLGETLDLPSLQAIDLQDASGAVSPLLRELLVQMNVRVVQLHHLIDHPPALRDVLPHLCTELGVPLEVTVHDYHFICPRINLVDASGRYCGEPERETCDRCLQRDELGRAAGRIGPWRAAHTQLLARARRVTVPDPDVAVRLSNYFPSLRAHVQPHEPLELPAQRPHAANPVREVLVIGALSTIKGYEVLLGLARSQAATQHGLRFTLLGHSPDDAKLRAAGVQVLGRYEDATLSARIEELAPDLILLPSVWPETFCYVLTNAASSGRRVAVFNLGAQARRLKEVNAEAIYLPIELAGKPDELVKWLTSAPSSAGPSRAG